jgi:hypothetical protein
VLVTVRRTIAVLVELHPTDLFKRSAGAFEHESVNHRYGMLRMSGVVAAVWINHAAGLVNNVSIIG